MEWDLLLQYVNYNDILSFLIGVGCRVSIGVAAPHDSLYDCFLVCAVQLLNIIILFFFTNIDINVLFYHGDYF